MKLTGKCKEDFEKWYVDSDNQNNITYLNFIKRTQSMQYGVYVDFFDSVEIKIIKKSHLTEEYKVYYKKYECWEYITIYNPNKTSNEARTKAIEKANEIYNKQ